MSSDGLLRPAGAAHPGRRQLAQVDGGAHAGSAEWERDSSRCHGADAICMSVALIAPVLYVTVPFAFHYMMGHYPEPTHLSPLSARPS